MTDCMTGAGSASPVVSMTTRFNGLDPARLHPVHEVGQRIDQFAAHGAAETAVGQFDDAVARRLDQQVIDPTSPNSLMITAVS